MERRSFTWNPNGMCIFGSITNPTSTCMFDYWSIHHFYFSGFIYIILHHLLNITNMTQSLYVVVLIGILHMIEEYLGNTSKISLEGLVIDYIGPLIDPKIDPSLRKIDNDYLENSIGDVLIGVISCLIISIYWNITGKLPYEYLYFIIIIIIMLLDKATHMLYNK